MTDLTIMLGSEPVRLLRRPWKAGPRQPYRKTYNLRPGQHWREAEQTHDQWECYVSLDDGEQIPVGALIASELMADGAQVAAFTEQWAGKCILADHQLTCVSDEVVLVAVLDEIRAETFGRLGGLPDVIGVFPDGTVAFREAKNVAARDKLGPKQHALADVLRKIFAGRMNLAVVEWDIGD